MALKMMLDSLDGLSEQEAGHYVKKGDKYELQVEGAKTQGDLDRVQKALNDERNVSKDLKAKLNLFEGLDAEEVKKQLGRIPELETLAEAGGKKLDEKQVEAIVNARIAPLKTENTSLKTNLDQANAKVVAYEAEKRQNTINEGMRALASEFKASPDAYGTAISPLMLLANSICEVDAAGQLVIKEKSGLPGVEHGTLLKDAFPAIQKVYASCWPPSSGTGAPGSNNSPGGFTKNVFKENNMTARGQLLQTNKEEAERQFKASGLKTYWDTYQEKK